VRYFVSYNAKTKDGHQIIGRCSVVTDTRIHCIERVRELELEIASVHDYENVVILHWRTYDEAGS
jgi:hypothetical protein